MSQWTSRPPERASEPQLLQLPALASFCRLRERCPCAAAIRYFFSRASDRPSPRNASWLPKVVRTSLAAWINDNPLARSHIADRARTLVPFTKEAMMYGGLHGLFVLPGGAIAANLEWTKRIAADLKDSTDEVQFCAKRAEFVGKWLASSGSSGTVMAILGVRS